MAIPAPWPTTEQLKRLSVDELGMRILWRLAERPGDKAHSRQGFIETVATEAARGAQNQQGFSVTYSGEALHGQRELARAVAEAWDWLAGEGLIALDPLTLPRAASLAQTGCFVTRWGKEVAARGVKGLDLAKAKRRLGLNLHPALADQLRPLVQVGAFEQAAFTALREVEQTVAVLAGNPTDKRGQPLRGEPLMNAAFHPDANLLADPEAEPAEQLGQMNLFKGAFAAFRNPLGHRSVEFADPTEAAEVVLFADLLMRQLKHIEKRLVTS